MFLGRINPDLLILLPCAISKDQNVFGVLQQKDLQVAFSCEFVQVGKARVTKGCN